MNSPTTIILASRSPQRLALLRQLFEPAKITVCPPLSSEEAGFDGLETCSEIEHRLQSIAREKCEDVLRQCRAKSNLAEATLLIAADTVIVADDDGRPVVLGKPPEPDWRAHARLWFENYLIGKTHRALTAVCMADLSGETLERVISTEVTFLPDPGGLLDWYLATEEPRGKAGGYGIQAAGSVFVSKVAGSISNVVGLPLREVWEMCEEFRSEIW